MANRNSSRPASVSETDAAAFSTDACFDEVENPTCSKNSERTAREGGLVGGERVHGQGADEPEPGRQPTLERSSYVKLDTGFFSYRLACRLAGLCRNCGSGCDHRKAVVRDLPGAVPLLTGDRPSEGLSDRSRVAGTSVAESFLAAERWTRDHPIRRHTWRPAEVQVLQPNEVCPVMINDEN